VLRAISSRSYPQEARASRRFGEKIKKSAAFADFYLGMALDAVSISVSWAIAQYRQVLRTVSSVRAGLGPPRLPKDPPDVVRYFRAMGIGRNIDVYA
jgi:hypothetical protein